MQRIGRTFLLVLLVLAPNAALAASPLQSGELLWADGSFHRAIFRTNPDTGERVVLSGCPNNLCLGEQNTGAGPYELQFRDIAIESPASIIIIGTDQARLIRADVASGDRIILSAAGIGTGPDFIGITDVEVGPGGSLLVSDDIADAIFLVDPETGDRSLLSSSLLGSEVGSGPALLAPAAIAYSPAGLFVLEKAERYVLRIDPVTGDRTVVYQHPMLGGPADLTVESETTLLGADTVSDRILRIDVTTGVATNISDAALGSGPLLDGQFLHLTFDSESQRLFVSTNEGEDSLLLEIDRSTGDRTIVASRTIGSGLHNRWALGLRVVPSFAAPVPTLRVWPMISMLVGMAIIAVFRLQRTAEG